MFKRKLPWPKVSFWFDGNEYQWTGWFGCQLESYEVFTFPAGTTRILKFGTGESITIRISTTKREGFKIRTTWAIPQTGSYAEYSEKIKDFQHKLASLV